MSKVAEDGQLDEPGSEASEAPGARRPRNPRALTWIARVGGRPGRQFEQGIGRIRTLLDTRNNPNAKPVPQQVREMIQLRRSTTRLSSFEYQLFELYDQNVYGDVDLSEMCGSHMFRWLHQMLNNPDWAALVSDKVNMALMFESVGIPQPKLYGVFARYDRNCGAAPVLRDPRALEAFLTDENSSWPMFCKPVAGSFGGYDCYRIVGVEHGNVVLEGADDMPVGDFVGHLTDPSGWGFLFQEAVLPAAETVAISAGSVTGLRMIVLLGDDGPVLFRTYWKIPGAGRITDNYGAGDRRTGLADIDVSTGMVRAVHWGASSYLNGPHPDTGFVVMGTRVPLWDDAVRTVLAAASSFPGFRWQHWDVGLTSKGPLIYELNNGGGLYDGCIPGMAGAYDEQLQRFVAEYGHGTQHRRLRGPLRGPSSERSPG